MDMDLSYEFPAADKKPRHIPFVPTQDALAIRFKHNQAIPLLRLPAELRLTIWEYILGGNWIIPETESVDYQRKYRKGEIKVNPPHFLSLLITCRQIYHETRLLPFSSNVWDFWYHKSPEGYYFSKCWQLNAPLIEGQRNAIGNIVIGFKDDERLRLSPRVMAVIGLLKGVRVVYRKDQMHGLDVEAIDKFAGERGLRVLEENLEEWTEMRWRGGGR